MIDSAAPRDGCATSCTRELCRGTHGTSGTRELCRGTHGTSGPVI
jgi:hypothetical protein